MADEGNEVERFHATNGRVVGVIGLALVLVVLVLELVDRRSDISLPVVVGCLLAGLVVWVVLLRPAARAEGDDLVLRGAVDTLRVPFAAIDRAAVGFVLVVVVGEKRYTNTSISRTRRESARDDKAGGDPAKQSSGAFVESRIRRRVEDAHAAGVPAGDVRREWAWPEIIGLAVLGVAFVLALVL